MLLDDVRIRRDCRVPIAGASNQQDLSVAGIAFFGVMPGMLMDTDRR